MLATCEEHELCPHRGNAWHPARVMPDTLLNTVTFRATSYRSMPTAISYCTSVTLPLSISSQADRYYPLGLPVPLCYTLFRAYSSHDNWLA